MNDNLQKIIIVEGKTDKQQIKSLFSEEVIILSTQGTFAIERFDYLLEEYQLDDHDVYVFVDEDEAGKKLRKELKRELPQATQIYTDPNYKEVAETPKDILAQILLDYHFEINPIYLFLKRR
ncbi:MAG TPA: toprim domain-containing protein [Pseudogracilibacillus sp.]|nr:toprim domain-containing protein [Pseudogracilibacillus sp.]